MAPVFRMMEANCSAPPDAESAAQSDAQSAALTFGLHNSLSSDMLGLHNSHPHTLSRSAFSVVSGIKYSLPGRTSRTELTIPEMRFILSIMTPLSSVRMILLCFPMISVIRVTVRRSPISSECSTSMRTILSRPGWDMPRIFPP